MRIACLADLHLGYVGAGRRENGRAVRTVDVERALEAAVDRIVERQPDLVTIAGDVFDSVTPPTASVVAFLEQIDRIITFTSAQVVIVGGNHETPRTVGVMGPNETAGMFSYNVHVVGEHRVLDLPDIGVVHCFPCSYLNRPGVVVPEPWPGRVNIAVIHAAVRSSARPGAVPAMYAGPDKVDVARLEGFDVVACGDFHEFRVLAPQFWGGWDEPAGTAPPGVTFQWGPDQQPVAFYSGSIERTSSNIWQERAPKGFVWVDTTARTLEFVEVPTRMLLNVDLWKPLTAEGVNVNLRDLLTDGGTQDGLCRLVVEDFPRAERDGIDWTLVRELQRRCVLFNLDLRYAEGERPEFTDRRARQGRSLADDARDFFHDDEPAVRAFCAAQLGLEVVG